MTDKKADELIEEHISLAQGVAKKVMKLLQEIKPSYQVAAGGLEIVLLNLLYKVELRRDQAEKYFIQLKEHFLAFKASEDSKPLPQEKDAECDRSPPQV